MARGGIGRASALLASGTMVSRVLGFVKAIVIAGTIGMVGSASADAFTNAQQLPSSIYSIIAGGILSAVLIPQVVRAARHADGGQTYINRLVTLAIVLLGGLSLVATLAVPLISRLYAASLTDEQLALVVALGYWCMPQVFFYGLYAVLGEILNARGMFGPFTWAPVVNNVVGIGGLWVFAWMFGADPEGNRTVGDWTPDMIAVLGGTATLGVAIQALILFVFWRKVGLTYRPDFRFRGTGLGKAGKLAGWTFGMLLILQVAGLVETNVLNLAFGAGASVAAFSNAYLIFALPHAVVTVSIATAFFTRMSEAASEQRTDDFVRDFSGGARLIGLFIVFAAFGIAVISPAFARIFENNPAGVTPLAILLCCFLVGLVPFCGLFLVQRAFYAIEDTRTQFWVFLATFPVNIFLMAMASLLPLTFIAAGLALTQSIMAGARLLVLFVLLRRRVGPLRAGRIVKSYLVYTVAAVVAALVGLAVMWFLGAYDPEGFVRAGRVQAIIGCAVGGLTMAGVYFVALLALRSQDLREAIAPILRRFGRGPAEVEEAEATTPEPEIDWTAGPPTELLQVEEIPGRPEPPTDPVDMPPAPTREELELAARRAAHVSDREERAYAGTWSMGMGATGDLTTAGIILPMHSTPSSGPRTRRERRELEARAAAALQAKRVAAERARAASERGGPDDGAGDGRPQERFRSVAGDRSRPDGRRPDGVGAPARGPQGARPQGGAPWPGTGSADGGAGARPADRAPRPRPTSSDPRSRAPEQQAGPPRPAPDRADGGRPGQGRPAQGRPAPARDDRGPAAPPPAARDAGRRPEPAGDEQDPQDLLRSWFGDDED